MSATLNLRKLQIGKDEAAAKNSTISVLDVGKFGINVGDLITTISSPVMWTATDVQLLDAKSQATVNLSDKSKRFATTEWVIDKFGGNDVFATWTTNGNITLVGLDIQIGGDWSRVLSLTDVVLVKDQIDRSKNGWYWPRETGWVRIDTKDTSGKISNNIMTRVSEGKNYSDTLWLLSSNISTSFLIDVSSLEYVQASDSRGPGKLIDIVKMSNNGYNSCLFLTRDGTLYEAHGSNTSFQSWQTGRGITNAPPVFSIPSAQPIIFPGTTSPVVDFVLGFGSSYALLANGELWVWGYNSYGELGLGHANQVPRPVLSTTNVTKLFKTNTPGTLAYNSMFIQRSDGYIYATGYNLFGHMGLGDTISKSNWTRLDWIGTNPLGVFPINVGSSLFVQKSDKTIWASGWNGTGILGAGDVAQKNTAVNVSAAWQLNVNMKIKKITGGMGWIIVGSSGGTDAALIMLLDDDTTTDLRCAGSNTASQLGDGTTTLRNTPVRPNVGAGRIKDIVTNADGYTTTYLLKENGDLYSWGYNVYGQVGNATNTNVSIPTKTLDNVKALPPEMWKYSHGYYSTGYVIREDGLYSVGYNVNGEAGWGVDTANRNVWSRVNLPPSLTWDRIKSMGNFTTAPNGNITILLTNDNVLWAWGHNGNNGILWNFAGTLISPVICSIFRGH